ncbi:histidine kinase [Marinobacter zhejiangensis]|uniref:AmpE protein n=1 Tax=Marinobacter zhejiangensis TaxID=488535 RepID=A0A1I4RCE8_9GAMM|nr:histidine kinase [Marinobacter zhejiangensis]SFM49911.1 AmpE protein [Marinobacter zhejiangensis]
MPLLIFLLAYVARRRLDAMGRFDMDPFFSSMFKRVAPDSGDDNGAAGVFLVAFAGLGLIVLEWTVASRGWSVLSYPVDLFLLLVLMGIPGWQGALKVYGDAWLRGDMQAAWHHVRDYLPPAERGQGVSPDAMHLSFSSQLLTVVFERYFLVVFWYVIGGIGLAVFVRGVVALRDLWPQPAVRDRFSLLVEIVAWLPARLLSFSFGLAGDFPGWLKEGRRYAFMPSVNARTVLFSGANSALTGYALNPKRFASLHPDEWLEFGGRSLNAIRDLLNRSMVVWVCLLALLVIAGWL